MTILLECYFSHADIAKAKAAEVETAEAKTATVKTAQAKTAISKEVFHCSSSSKDLHPQTAAAEGDLDSVASEEPSAWCSIRRLLFPVQGSCEWQPEVHLAPKFQLSRWGLRGPPDPKPHCYHL